MDFREATKTALYVGAMCGVLSSGGCNEADSARSAERVGHARQAHIGSGTASGADAPPPAESRNLTLVGQQSFGHRGNFGDVWVHRNYAYVGSFRVQGCPGHGVSVADVSSPARPTAAGTFAAHRGTSAEDVEVISMANRHFTGSLAAVGLQDCSEDPDVVGEHGLELWDTTDPRRPVRLGFYNTSTNPLGGVHELKLFRRDGRYYAILATNFYEIEPAGADGEVLIIDVTNPRAPVKVSDWSAVRDGHFSYGSPLYTDESPGNCDAPPGGISDCRVASSGGYPAAVAHSASVSRDGNRAFISYWDAGMVTLNIRDLARPRMISRANSAPTEEGDLHSAIDVPYFCNNIAITTDEDFSPRYNTEAEPTDVWGFARIWDLSNPARPRQIGRIDSPHSASNRTDGIYAAHNPVAVQNLAFFSWYTDGVRVYDIANPRSPQLVAYFDAPRVPDPAPTELETLPTGAIWGITVRPPYVYASDMNAGLYVLRMSASVLSRIRGAYSLED